MKTNGWQVKKTTNKNKKSAASVKTLKVLRSYLGDEWKKREVIMVNICRM